MACSSGCQFHCADIADPREAQLRLLREIARALKPDGEVYLGIENRVGYGYFLGKPDEHSKLKYATLLPRSWANRYALAKRREPYRTYTYSWRGYRKLLRDAGFTTARFYCPFPEYREFSELIDLDRPRNLARALYPTSFLGRFGMQVCKRVNVFREFSPTYSIIASKTRVWTALLTACCATLTLPHQTTAICTSHARPRHCCLRRRPSFDFP